MDESTTLADLLELNLHDCEEEVKNIVDKAVKEMSMEKYMRELNVTWSKMEFEKEIHARTGATLIRASEELIETLEENQVRSKRNCVILENKDVPFFVGPASESDHFEIHRSLLGRSVQLAAKFEHRGPSDHNLVRGAKNLDAPRKYLHVLRRYTKAITRGR